MHARTAAKRISIIGIFCLTLVLGNECEAVPPKKRPKPIPNSLKTPLSRQAKNRFQKTHATRSPIATNTPSAIRKQSGKKINQLKSRAELRKRARAGVSTLAQAYPAYPNARTLKDRIKHRSRIFQEAKRKYKSAYDKAYRNFLSHQSVKHPSVYREASGRANQSGLRSMREPLGKLGPNAHSRVTQLLRAVKKGRISRDRKR